MRADVAPKDPVADILNDARIVADFQLQADMVAGVRGWLYPIEGYCLARLAEHGPGEGAIVEIGSFMGLSTAYLAAGTKRAHREPVTAIDHFRGSAVMQKGGDSEVPEIVTEGSSLRVFRENMERLALSDYVIPVVKSSAEAARDWREPIRLLFIDGDHSFEGARADFEAFERAVIPGGVICFHDIGVKEGVTEFFRQLVASRDDYEHVSTQQCLAILVKRSLADSPRGT